MVSLPATSNDYSPAVAGLIRSTASAFWDWVFNYDQDALVQCMEAWWKSPETVWSYRNARLVKDADQPVALLLSFSHKQFANSIGPTVDVAGNVLTQAALQHMLQSFGWVRAIVIEIPDDVIYVNQVAVAPQQRGKGIGGKLLLEEFSRARTAGFKAVELDVNQDNPQARKLYERLGMQLFATISAPALRRHGFETHHRMRIDL